MVLHPGIFDGAGAAGCARGKYSLEGIPLRQKLAEHQQRRRRLQIPAQGNALG